MFWMIISYLLAIVIAFTVLIWIPVAYRAEVLKEERKRAA